MHLAGPDGWHTSDFAASHDRPAQHASPAASPQGMHTPDLSQTSFESAHFDEQHGSCACPHGV